MLGETSLDRVAAERAPGVRREQRVVGLAGALGEPGAQDRDGLGGQRRDALLATLAQAADVRSDAELNVAAGEAGELRCPQSGLGAEQQHRVIAAAGPSAAVRRGQERVELGFGQERDQRAFEALGWDRQDALIVAACSGWRSAA